MFANVAQLVEQLLRKREVAGSIPAIGSKFDILIIDMKKKKTFVFGLIIIVVVLIIGFVYAMRLFVRDTQSNNSSDTEKPIVSESVTSAFATYTIEGNDFVLREGVSLQHNVLNSAVSEKVTLSDLSVESDFDKDARVDTAVVLVHEPGGTGTFYYVAVAFQKTDSYVTSNTIFLGDRIVVTGLQKTSTGFSVNYLDRRADQDFSTSPTVAKTASFAVDASTMKISKAPDIVSVPATNADKLLGSPWKWIKTNIVSKEQKPKNPDAFSIKFNADDSFSVTTDCNSAGGSYAATHSLLEFGPMFTTLMYCENSQESEFLKTLEKVGTYRFDAPNYLVLELNGGEIHFTR